MKTEALGKLIAGPVGSGKTVGCIFDLLTWACAQPPGSDGLRYSRFAIVRQTLSQLLMTVKKDIETWLKGGVEWKVSEKTFYLNIGDVRSEWILIPLEDPEDQQRLLSMQLTGAWMSEAIEMDVDLVPPLMGRCGRYPYGENGLCARYGVIADTNMPSVGSPWHDFMKNPPKGWEIFRQPGGLTAQAENLDHLLQTERTIKLPLGHPERRAQGRVYYEQLANNRNADWVKRYVNAEYGNDPSGTAVFRTSFRRDFHVVEDLEPVANRILIIGQDFGRDPFSVITQLDHKGRLLVLEEVAAEDTGLEKHIQSSLRPALLNARYVGRAVAICGDPTGQNRSSLYEENEFDLLRRRGFDAFPAPTNDPDSRILAVESFFLGAAEGGPAILINGARCPILVAALDGGYRFSRTKAGVRKPRPDKNEFSHVADALQYACLASGGQMHRVISGRVLGRGARRANKDARRISSLAWT